MKRRQNVPVQRLILETLMVAGGLSLATVAPNVLGALRAYDPAYARRKNVQRRIKETLWRMERAGLVRLPKMPRERVSLLPKGIAAIEQVILGEYRIPKPILWDGKWRVVMFDVPEKRKNIRHRLRKLLEQAGLVRLHDSVWVHPYPCDELVTLVKAHLKNTRGELHYFVAELMASDRFLRDAFSLA